MFMKQVFSLLLLISASIGTLNAQQLTREYTCRPDTLEAVIPIYTERGSGTGFVVSADGWIVTAAHVVIDPDTKQADKSIRVVLPNSETPAPAVIKSTNDAFTRDHDFAFLKVDGHNLKFLTLGDPTSVALGSDNTIIGFPFNATNRVPIKFCLSAIVASWATFNTPSGSLEVLFFQGPSIKGISGSPVISRTTGQVIAIADASLAGIGPALKEQERLAAASRGHGSVTVMGVDVAASIGGLIGTLDDQLVNGLGQAIIIKTVSEKLTEVQKQDAEGVPKN